MGATTVNGIGGSGFNTGMQSPSADGGQTGRFRDYSTSKAVGSTSVQSSNSSYRNTSIKDRITYPFRAIKNRLINCAILGGFVGSIMGFSIPALVGSVVGGCAGGIVKLAKMLGGNDSATLKKGAALGAITGALVSLPVAITLGTVTAAAFTVIGLAGSVIHMPVDIYRAATLNRSELKPDLSYQSHMKALNQQMEELSQDTRKVMQSI